MIQSFMVQSFKQKKEKNKLIDIILRLQLNYSNNGKKTDKQTYPYY